MKILIIGYGSIAQKHCVALNTLVKDVKIYALRSSKEANMIKGVFNVFSFSEIQNINPDFIIISNPTIHHEETIKNLIGFKKPLFIEKPSLHSLSNADTLALEIKEIIISTYVACNLRFLDCIQFVKKQLETTQHQLNEVNIYAGSYLPKWRPGKDFKKVYSANKDMGGGVHLDLIHELDYLYWFFGMPEKTNALLRSKSTLDIDAIDYAQYCLIYDTFVANVTLNYFRRDYKRKLELVFENETWEVDLSKNQIVSGSNKVIYESSQTILDTYVDQMAYFLKFVRNKSTESLNTFSDSINVLKIALAQNV